MKESRGTNASTQKDDKLLKYNILTSKFNGYNRGIFRWKRGEKDATFAKKRPENDTFPSRNANDPKQEFCHYLYDARGHKKKTRRQNGHTSIPFCRRVKTPL